MNIHRNIIYCQSWSNQENKMWFLEKETLSFVSWGINLVRMQTTGIIHLINKYLSTDYVPGISDVMVSKSSFQEAHSLGRRKTNKPL